MTQPNQSPARVCRTKNRSLYTVFQGIAPKQIHKTRKCMTKGKKSYIHGTELYSHRNTLQCQFWELIHWEHLTHIKGDNHQKELFVHDLRTVRRGRTSTSHTDRQTDPAAEMSPAVLNNKHINSCST